jgi:hypothetical protein
MHLSFKNLVVTSTLSLQASLMYIQHNTSIKFILEDDSISSTSRICICSYSSKGAGLWLVANPSIHSFHIAHSTFTLTLHFRLDLIQPLTFSFLTCECGHKLDIFGTRLVHCPFGGQWIATHDTIWNVMYAFAWKGGHVVWRKRWYTLTLGVSLQIDLYMTQEDKVFVANVLVIDLMREMVVWTVVSWLANAAMKFSSIVKIHKCKRLHEGHHFIPMAVEVHGAFRHDMNRFIK